MYIAKGRPSLLEALSPLVALIKHCLAARNAAVLSIAAGLNMI